MSDQRQHILFLPEWYRNPTDEQLAVFVEKHARAAALNYQVSLIYCGPFSTSGEVEMTYKKHEHFTEYFCFYPKAGNAFKAYKHFLKAHEICFKKVIEDHGVPELVHLHMLFRNYVAYEKVYAKKAPHFMITEQWSGYLSGAYQKLGFFKKHWYKKAFRSSLINTGVSVKLATAIDKLFKTRKPTVVLPNIAEATHTGQKKNTDELRILVVADLVDKIKNISGVIVAFAQAKLDRRALLTIVGDGIDRASLEQLAAEQPLDNRKIEFKGRYENAQVLVAMQENDFLITNSYHETFSMVTAEALLAGMPVICTRCGGPEEFVNEANGILIDTGNTEQLKSAIEKMSRQHSSYLTSDLSQPVLEKFGIEAVGHQLQKIYARILG